MDIKTGGVGFFTPLAVVVPLLGVVWGITEPIVEDYLHEQVKVVQEEDKRMITELEDKIKDLKSIVDKDYSHNLNKRNLIINEIHYIYPNSRLNKE